MNKESDTIKETEFTQDTISLILEDGTEIECDILAIFPVKKQSYVALLPQRAVPGYESGEYFLYRYWSDGENTELSDIETEEELEAAEDRFEELMDEEEFNRMD